MTDDDRSSHRGSSPPEIEADRQGSRPGPAPAAGAARRPPSARGAVRNLFARLRDTLGLFVRLHREHGGIVRYRLLFLEFCILFDPELIREVVDEQRTSFEKGFIYKRNTVLHGPTLVTGDGEDHRRRRRIIQPFFHRDALAGYASTMAERAVAKREEWRPGQVVDADREMRDLTLSISLRVFFDDRTRIDVQMARDLIALLILDFKLALLPGRAAIKRALPRYRRLQRRKEPLDEIVLASIRAARDAPPGTRTDLTAFLACAVDEQGGPAFSELEVLDEVIEMLMASHETTGATLAWAFWFLDRNPSARERLEQEVDEVLGDRPATLEDYDRLVYARAALDETLRLATPSYYIGRRAVADCTVGGYAVPAGSNVQLCCYAAHRDARYFPEPDRFRPERWLAPQPERPKYAYMPFGAGSRGCVGEAFARMSAVYALAAVARRWRLEAVSDGPPALNTMAGYFFRDGLPVRVSARPEAP